MEPEPLLIPNIPRTILLLGTDASGKNHVAALWAQRLRDQGCDLVVREGWLNGEPARTGDHGEKGKLSLLAERIFIILFPLMKWALPTLMGWLIRLDAARFKAPQQNLLVISHNAMRVLALCVGIGKKWQKEEHIPKTIGKALVKMQKASDAMVVVLDVEDETRQKRIQRRLQEGSIDPFDQYMAADSERSEHIEACLVAIASRFCQAHLVENNDLSDDELWAQFVEACAKHQASVP